MSLTPAQRRHLEGPHRGDRFVDLGFYLVAAIGALGIVASLFRGCGS